MLIHFGSIQSWVAFYLRWREQFNGFDCRRLESSMFREYLTKMNLNFIWWNMYFQLQTVLHKQTKILFLSPLLIHNFAPSFTSSSPVSSHLFKIGNITYFTNQTYSSCSHSRFGLFFFFSFLISIKEKIASNNINDIF